MAQHYMSSLSGTEPFPLTARKARSSELKAGPGQLRVWLARALFFVLFAGVLALLAYEIRVAYDAGWRPHVPAWIHKL